MPVSPPGRAGSGGTAYLESAEGGQADGPSGATGVMISRDESLEREFSVGQSERNVEGLRRVSEVLVTVVADAEGVVPEAFEFLFHVEVVPLQLEVEPVVDFTDDFVEGELFLQEGGVCEGGRPFDAQLQVLDLLHELFAQSILFHLAGKFLLVLLWVHSVEDSGVERDSDQVTDESFCLASLDFHELAFVAERKVVSDE